MKSGKKLIIIILILIPVISSAQIEKNYLRAVKEKYLSDSADSVNPSDNRFSISAGAGFGIPYLFGREQLGYNFQFNISKKISNGFSIRLNSQVLYSPGKENSYTLNDIPSQTLYNFSLEFLPGKFRNNSKTNLYWIFGGGLMIYDEGEQRWDLPVYDSTGFTGKYATSVYEGNTYYCINLNAGGGVSYKLSDNLRWFTELQYSFPLATIGGPLGEGFLMQVFYGSPTLKTGLQFSF